MKTFIYSILFVAFGFSAIAQAPVNASKSQKIDELMSILGSKAQYQAFIDVGLENLVAQYGSQLANTDKQILKEEAVKIITLFLDTDMKNIYAKYLTEKEIVDLIAFYSSETGRRFMQIQPSINQEVNLVLMQKYMPQFKEMIGKRLMSQN